MSPTNALADDILKLKKDQKAPYQGVLMPEEDFRWFKSQEKRAFDLDKYILEEKPNIPREEPSPFLQVVLPMLFGAALFWGVESAIRQK